jgi:hypothetical protein
VEQTQTATPAVVELAQWFLVRSGKLSRITGYFS